MTNFAVGRQAEAAAVEYLRANKYKILEQNWRTRYCEIDIVASKDEVVYFVEVKYRENDKQGTGLDYVTPKKLKQINFAAEMWLSSNDWAGDCTLAALEVSGPNFAVTNFVEDLV